MPRPQKADIGVAMGDHRHGGVQGRRLHDPGRRQLRHHRQGGGQRPQRLRQHQNAIQFLLSGNTAGIFCVLYASLLALPVPFQPVHLLFINLLTDSLPALAIGMEPADDDLLKEKPRNPREGILTRGL